MKTLWDLLKEMISKRWVRYLVAALFPLFGVLIALQALIGMRIQTASGAIHSIEIRRDAQTGEYKEHLLTLDTGGNTHYILEAGYFTPTLTENTLREGERIDLWYEQTPLFDPDVIAVQVYDAQGAAVKYTTNAYAHPEGTRTNNLVTGGVFLLVGLLALAAAIWLPVHEGSGTSAPRGKGSKPAEQPASAPRYGEWVVGPSRQRTDAPGLGDDGRH